MRCLLAVLALSLLPARVGAEGSTLSSEKVGACALLTAADAQSVWNVPMAFQSSGPEDGSPGRNCAYRPVEPGPGRGTLHLRLLDAREWSHLEAEADAGKLEKANAGLGDEAYVITGKRARRAGAVVLYVRRGHSQFSLRFAGAGPALTDPMKQVASDTAGRLPAGH